VLLAAVVAAVAVTVLGVRMVQLHDAYGEWRLTATETPARLSALGRDYDRGDLRPGRAVPSGYEAAGEAEDGGTLLVPSDLHGRVPVVIYVRDDEGRVWTYALVGGP
jgi:hypothetical protein